MAPVRQAVERDEQGAPKARLPSIRAQKGINSFFANRANIDQAMEDGKLSKFYDWHSPATRQKRRIVQADYEWAMREYLGRDTVSQSGIYNLDTFKEYTKLYLSCCAAYIEGKIGAKPKAGTLYYRLRALIWWAVRRIDRFDTIYSSWYAEAISHIYFIADMQGFEKGFMEKNQLGEAELTLFYRTLPHLQRGRELWKQSYLSWLLVFMCGVRPGSYTVSKGYEKDARIGDGSVLREEDETLRWSDCEFRRVESGVAVKVTFQHLKGNRNPHTQRPIDAQKTWTFFPIGSNRYEFDLALLVTATASSRGLFGSTTLEQLFNGSELYPQSDPGVNSHPVFLASDQAEKLCPGKPMRLASANFKLQDMCKYVGLFGRNTVYGFRRTMIQEVRRKHGTEYAKDAASHAVHTDAIEYHDNVGQADIDWVADRLDESGLSHKQIRELYSQVATQRIALPDSEPQTIAQDLKNRIEARVRADPAYSTTEVGLQAEINDLAQLLQEIPVLISNVQVFRARLLGSTDPAHAARLRKLDEMLAARKALRKQLRRVHERDVRKSMLQIQRSELQMNKPADVQSDSDEDGSTVNVDGSVVDDALADTRQEPESWATLPNDVELHFDADRSEEIAASEQGGRLGFAKDWIAFESPKNSGLTCLQCLLDDSISDNARKYTLSDLDRHMKSDIHTRKNQLLRAFTIDKDADGKAPCPLCQKEFKRANFWKHVEKEHVEQI